MRMITYAELETKIRADLDMQDSDNFCGQDEMAGLVNEAIDTAEALIMTTCEDYFLTSSALSLLITESTITLPTDIYGQKIRGITYINGDRIYPLEEIKDPEMFYRKAVIDRQATSLEEYQYFLKSATAGAQDKLLITPAAQESGAYLEMWYIRNANRIVLQAAPDSATRAAQLAIVIDIPEWRVYLEQYVKARVYEKMENFVKMAAADKKLEAVAQLLLVNLKDRKQNNRNEIPPDISHYVEHN